jgi:type I restriction enzyme S subunit
MNKPGYKNTPLGWIPEDWTVKEFGSVVIKSQYGVSNPTANNGNYPIVGMKNIQNGELHLNQLSRIQIDEADIENLRLKQNDFLFNRTNSYDLVGKSVLVDRDVAATFASYLVRFKIDEEKADPKFICYFFNTSIADKKLKAIATKAVGQANINPTILQKRFAIPLPPLPEQQRIAAILSTWDAAIAKEMQLIDAIQTHQCALMRQLLSGKRRLKGFEVEWKKVPISDIAEEVSIKNKFDKNIIVLSCTKYDGLVPSLEYFGRKIYSDDLRTYKIVPKDHFAYATNHIEEGSIGYQDKYDEGLISPMYTVFSTNNQVIDNFFAFRLLKTQQYILEYRRRMEGSIDRRGGLRWDEFSKIELNLPPPVEQTAIAAILRTSDREIQFHRRHLAALQRQKKSLMQVLLTGKLRVKTTEL